MPAEGKEITYGYTHLYTLQHALEQSIQLTPLLTLHFHVNSKKEAQQFSLVVKHPAFKAQPMSTITEHIKNSVALMQQREQEKQQVRWRRRCVSE